MNENISPLEILKLERPIKLDHKRTMSTAASNIISNNRCMANNIIQAKYSGISDNYYAFDVIAMTTMRPRTKALTTWQEVQLFNPGEYDYFNGYCKASRHKFHLTTALKYHQFNLDRPVFYRLDAVADTHELNIVRQKMVQKRAIEQALKNLSLDQVEACFVDLKHYSKVEVLLTEDNTKPVEDKLLDLSQSFVVYKAIRKIAPSVPIRETWPIDSQSALSVHESYYYVDSDKIFAGYDQSIIESISEGSFECPSYFTVEHKLPSEVGITSVRSRQSSARSSKSATINQDHSCFASPSLIQAKQTPSSNLHISRVASPAISGKYLMKYRLTANKRLTESREVSNVEFRPLKKSDIGSKQQLTKKAIWESPMRIRPEQSRLMTGLVTNHTHKPSFSISELANSKKKMQKITIKATRASPDRANYSFLQGKIMRQESSDLKSKTKGSSFIIRSGNKAATFNQKVKTSDNTFSQVHFQTSGCYTVDQGSPEYSKHRITSDIKRSTEVRATIRQQLKKSIVAKLFTKNTDCFAMYRKPQQTDEAAKCSPLYASLAHRRQNKRD